MRLRHYLMIANGVSLAVILLCLFVSYYTMLLTFDGMIWLCSATLGAGLLSFAVHYMMTRPLESSIRQITEKSRRIATGEFQGEFQGEVPQVGPLEFQSLANQFNEMNARLGESFRQLRTSEASRRELVANVSHDLRTPMASIQSFVEALQDDIVKDEKTFRQYLTTIRQETTRLSAMVDDLFQLSRLEAGVEKFDPEPQHLDSLLLGILQSLTFQLERKELRVVTDIPDSLPRLALMPLKIERVLGNLLHNAIRHSPQAGAIRLEASVGAAGSEWVRLSVTDEGEGIAEEEQAFVFERFYRTDKSRNRESGGSGLGLAIAKSIVELHGGEVGVRSSPGAGSTFWITLPVYRM
jgi:two-component system sensor histidine kinase SaeS